MLIKGKTKWSCFPGAPCGSLSISEAIICPGQPSPHCCPDGCQLPRCLHGLCSLAASRTQMYCSVFVNRLKIPWCCSSEGPGVQRGWEGSWGQAASGEQAQSHGTVPSSAARVGAGWKGTQHISHSLVSCCPGPAEPAVPGLLRSVFMVCKCARCDLQRPRAFVLPF